MNYLDKRISVFENLYSVTPQSEIIFGEYFDRIKNGYWEHDVRGFKDGYITKNDLPAVTPSGIFTEKKDAGLRGKHTGILVLDLDGKDNPSLDIEELKQTIFKSKSVLAVHKSVSGKGLAIYVAIADNLSPNDYNHIRTTFEEYFRISLDSSTKNISRLRIVSYDSEILIKEGVDPFHIEQPKAPKKRRIVAKQYTDSDGEYDRAYDAINKVISRGIDPTSTRIEWVAVGFAICCLGESGRELFQLASSNYPNYNREECDDKYSTLLKDFSGRTGLGLLISKMNTY